MCIYIFIHKYQVNIIQYSYLCWHLQLNPNIVGPWGLLSNCSLKIFWSSTVRLWPNGVVPHVQRCTVPLSTSSCWWKKSYTSWYGKCPISYRVLYIPGGCLGFLNHQQFQPTSRTRVFGCHRRVECSQLPVPPSMVQWKHVKHIEKWPQGKTSHCFLTYLSWNILKQLYIIYIYPQ